MRKKRIDILLVERRLAESREQAKRLILAGSVTVNGESQIKPGHRVAGDAEIVVQQYEKYVSRGGMKLEKALRLFDVDVQNRIALDVGASTGGFTDCLLQHGAGFVYAVDVGYGQLAWKLRIHPQVQAIEKTNIRQLASDVFRHQISLAVIDVSFISLRTVLPVVVNLLTTQHEQAVCDDTAGCAFYFDIITLMKPQFEAGRAHVKKGGVVHDKQVHIQIIDNLIAFVTQKLGVTVMGLTYSPIHSGIGNIEYLLWLRKSSAVMGSDSIALQPEPVESSKFISEVVHTAHRAFFAGVIPSKTEGGILIWRCTARKKCARMAA